MVDELAVWVQDEVPYRMAIIGGILIDETKKRNGKGMS